jgi:FkbM family methyltransferase
LRRLILPRAGITLAAIGLFFLLRPDAFGFVSSLGLSEAHQIRDAYRRRAWLVSAKLDGAVPYLSWSAVMKRMPPDSHLEQFDAIRTGYVKVKALGPEPCPVLWETPIGDFWGRTDDGGVLQLLIREQYGERFGPGPAYEAHVYQMDPVVIRSGDVVLDAGAHLGTFSKAALDKGAGKVVAFEPEPGNAACYKRTFAKEISQGRVALVEAALWDAPGALTLTGAASFSDVGSVVLYQPEPSGVQVKATTIDETVQQLHLERVDFVKMDIEGAERHALSGGRETLARFGPRMAICTYHLKDDPVAIPQVVMAARPSYKTFSGPRQVYFY